VAVCCDEKTHGTSATRCVATRPPADFQASLRIDRDSQAANRSAVHLLNTIQRILGELGELREAMRGYQTERDEEETSAA
jgi:hypothetical protein